MRRNGVRAAARRPAFRRRVLLGGWLAAGILILGRAVELQVLEGGAWREEALKQHRKSQEVPAARGAILDRDGVPLALSHETYRVSVAPHELADAAEAASLLQDVLQLPARTARHVTRPGPRWVVAPGRYPPAVREALAGVRGVYLERDYRRFHPRGDLAQGVLGAVIDGVGAGGIEQAFDSILSGSPGREITARDSQGRPIPGESWLVQRPRPGGEVVLTLDLDLQEIGQEALREAMDRTGARAGDLLVTDPRSGEVLALVSLRTDGTSSLSAINTPYEPGSTLKPFTVSTLLAQGAASLSDSVDTGNGTWRVAGRTISDVHAYGAMTLADALRVSSNVGVAKLAERLSQAQQYEGLRDFGFGVATGIELPGEATGTLRRPQEWSRQSPASLAIGYEIAVTPLQMAMAYGALANGGRLMEPVLVREVRSSDGRTVRRSRPREVRRVVPERVTRELSRVLVDVVEEGTGRAARITTFAVAGKSGTSRAYAASGGYERGSYYSSFVGFFPAEHPQLVVFVKLERPQGAYYGGATAAPVTRATLESILAARQTPLNRTALLSIARRVAPSPPPAPMPDVRFASSALSPAQEELPAAVGAGAMAMPDVSGLPARVAVRRLHAVGLRVVWEGSGTVAGTAPRAGTRVVPGDTVLLRPGGRRDG